MMNHQPVAAAAASAPSPKINGYLASHPKDPAYRNYVARPPAFAPASVSTPFSFSPSPSPSSSLSSRSDPELDAESQSDISIHREGKGFWAAVDRLFQKKMQHWEDDIMEHDDQVEGFLSRHPWLYQIFTSGNDPEMQAAIDSIGKPHPYPMTIPDDEEHAHMSKKERAIEEENIRKIKEMNEAIAKQVAYMKKTYGTPPQ
jgi:hypothetical protein